MSRGTQRPVANREQILAAAREIGISEGWRAVTIRALADKLSYASPVLYEHFRNKEDVLTQVAVEGLNALNQNLRRDIPQGSGPAILILAARYWSFMLEQPRMYRLMNGMDGAPVNPATLAAAARSICEATGEAARQWLTTQDAVVSDLDALTDQIWALLHGMASLYLDRATAFTSVQVQGSVLSLLTGATVLARIKA